MKKFFLVMVMAICLSFPVFAASERELFENGIDFLKQDKFQEAIDAFTALIDMAPENPDAYRNRGVAYMKLNLYDQAIKDFERAKQISPDLKGLYSNLGVAWYYKADYSKAIENYDKEILLSPDNYFTYFNRAICLYELKNYEKSFADITKTLELSPDFYLALCLEGDLYSKMNQGLKARQAYEKAIRINPDQAYAREQLAGLKFDPPPKEEVSKELPLVTAPVMKQKKILAPKKKSTSMENSISPEAPEVSGNYELQTGAYTVRDNAVDMQKKLEQHGYEAKILELTRPNQITWYLVRTGVYSQQEEAQKGKAVLEKDLKIEALIRPFGQF